MRISKYMGKVIESNSGVSSTRFNLVYIGIACSILLLCIGFVLVYDTVYDGKLDLNLSASITFSSTMLAPVFPATHPA